MTNITITKKILRIKKGEYLLGTTGEGVMTTFDANKAMDITNWSLEQLGYIISNLKRVGYKRVEVETVTIEQPRDAVEESTRRMRESLGNTITDSILSNSSKKNNK